MGGLKSFFVITVLFVALFAGSIVSDYGKPLSNVSTLPSTMVFTSPSKVFGLTGQTVNIKANIAGVTDLFSFQLGLLFDSGVVECLDVEEGGFLSNNGADEVISLPSIDNSKGMVFFGCYLLNSTKAKDGNGILVNLTFSMKETGYSDIHIYGLIAQDASANQIPCKIIDVYTPIREWSEWSISIVGNAQGQEPAGAGGYSAHNLTKLLYLELRLLSFNVTGFLIDGDTFAFCNVSIPRCLMWADNLYGIWYLFLNNVLHDITTLSENATHTSLYFEFAYNESNPTTNVKIGVAWYIGYSIPKAELSVSMSNWWFVHGTPVTIKARFTVDDVGVSGGTVLFKVTYPNMSVWLNAYNYTEPNGNTTFTFFINPDMPFGNYTVHVLAGKLGLPGACAVKFFWVWRAPLIEPYPWQYSKYRYHMYDINGSLYEYGWWNITYMGYVAPNLVNCSFNLFIISRFTNFSQTDWACINTTTRWVPEGTTMVNSFYELWVQTNVTIGSEIAIATTTATVMKSDAALLRMTDGTLGFVDCWIVKYPISSTINTLWFDKKTGLRVYAEIIMMTKSGNFTAYLELADTNIPIAYDFGDINNDGVVNSTDATLMQSAWQARVGDVNYDSDIDFNKDSIINIKDATLIGLNW